MRKGMGGVALVAAASFLTFYSSPREEVVQEVSFQVTENRVNKLQKQDPLQ